MVLGRILPRGQVTLPRDVRRAAGLAPGDAVMFRVVGEGKVEIQALPKLTLEEALERFRIEGDWEEDYKRGGWQDDAVKDIFGSSDE
jgi:antitoxin PrlF